MPYQFDPPNRNKFGYKDTLPADHPEKIIKGYEFDDEFKKIEDYTTQLEQDIEQISIDAGGIEEAPFDQIAYARQQGDWTPVDVVLQSPDAGAYIRKDVTDVQQIISTEFTFAFDGGVPLTMKNTGMYVNADYIRHNATEWEVSPSLNVLGDITAGGDLTVNGETQLNGNLSVDGTIDATGNISTEANLNVIGDITGGGSLDITGDITGSGSLEISGNITGGGDITLNGGNIIIDGGSIVDPDGNPANGNAYLKDADLIPDAHNVYAVGEDAKRFTRGYFSQQVYAFGGNSDLWNTAYQWGDHSKAGYATEAWVNGKNYSTYTGADAVKTSGNQTIGGAKTFSSNVTAPDFVATSDERLKTNIVTVPLGAIDQIRGVEFDWRAGGERASGVIAQEVEAVPALSHLVRNSGDEAQTRVVSYMSLIPYLIEEVKALKLEVQALKDGG